MSNVAARVVIVDDEVAQVRALCDTLTSHGYETEGYTKGEAALDAVRDRQFELVLTDLTMPGMDGITLLRRALELDPDLVGVIMTGQGTVATAVEAMKTGAIDYILKPFKLNVILPVLSRALTIRRLRLDNAELERRVHERTAELETANRELEAFSFSVSHDLRAPLRAVSAFSRMVITDHAAQIPAAVHDLIEQVIANARRMDQLIDDLLRLSRLSRQPFVRERVDLNGLVEDVVAELRREHADRAVDVQIDSLPDAVGDPSLLKQVYANLLSNAFKFTRQTENPVITVGCTRQDGESVYFVRDNGAGFEMAYATKLFAPFQRMHLASEFEGTGVGLSIVQRIVHRHGGRIWADAAVNQGATFHFTLPGSAATTPAAEESQSGVAG
jgi:two-component system sensor histidine kinase/response regulator